jgi:chorismate mutase
MQTIRRLRLKIDKIDENIIKNLAKRDKIVIRIGKLKNKSSKKIVDTNREDYLMHLYDKLSEDFALKPSYVKRLFKMIITHSRKLQRS